MKGKIFGLIGAALFGLVLSQLTIGDDSRVTGQVPTFHVVDQLNAEYGPVPKEDGAGYKPEVETTGECVCECDGKCLNEDDVRKIVRDEFNNQVLAEKQAPRSSIPNAVSYSTPSYSYSSPVVTYSTPTVTYSQPTSTTTVRRGVFGRTIYRTTTAPTSGVCRIVNGVRVCN